MAVTPDNFVTETAARRAEHGVQQQLQIVAGSGVAMQEQAARRPEHAVDLAETLRYAHQVGQPAARPDRRFQPFQKAREFRGRAADGVEARLRGVIPRPGVGEGLRLSSRPIVAAGVEWRVDIAEVDGFVHQVVSQHFQVVAAK